MHVNEALNDNNYLDWIQEMENFLFAKNKIGFVDGTLKKPEEKDTNHMSWLRCDAMIKGWLTTAMEKEIRVSVKYANSAREIWTDLQERFGKESAPRAYELKQLLVTTKQEGSSVSAYYTRLRTLWDEIGSVFSVPKCSCTGCTCGISKRMVESKDKERLYEFLLGLDSEFLTIRTQILAMKPVPVLSEAYHLVAEDEQQRAVSTGKRTNTDSAAFQASMKRDGSVATQNRSGPKTNKKPNNDKLEHCDFCGKDGHNRDGCFKRIGYPEWWPGKTKLDKGRAKAACVEASDNKDESSPIPGLNGEQYKQFINMLTVKDSSSVEITQPLANMAGRLDDGSKWIVDSGCTEHITPILDSFHGNIETTRELPVTIPNGDSIPVKGKGSCTLSNGIKISDVLYIPEFTCNLLSVSRLTQDLHCTVTFFPDFFIMQDLSSRKLIGTGKCQQGLYRMRMVGRERMAMAVGNDVWHRHLGHASHSKLSFLDFVSFKTNGDVCDSCAKAKFTRLPFISSSIKTGECFELLHCDIWGKYLTPTLTGANYFITIVDDFSRSVWVYLLK
ncbi:putative RNA-directed DNA polymerase [Helianthus annuus]|uniref:RNA-directed DNA polymerase n=1 Tax=Helianthus annuus TaxID=4232 RepID=A0A9K3HSR5_HELAN|nr:putative RNA-directed DNA polymerase [Helianthus annuus]KAJ0877086.1 putative RNA-directed DNA polymerase [Helianthus annuus]